MATETGGGFCLLPKVFWYARTTGKLKCCFKRKVHLRLLVDDAHGFGTLGKQELEQVRRDCQDGIDVYFYFANRWLILVLCSC
jgi:glycine C-acetyltransferase